MNQPAIKSINREIFRRFPEVKDTRPKIQVQTGSKGRSIVRSKTYLLVYRKKVNLADGHSMLRVVRVVANEHGEILKISTSR